MLESDEVSLNQPYIHRSMADGCPEMVFHYKGRFDEIFEDGKTDASFISGIHGQSQKFTRFRIKEAFGIFGVYLLPFALPQLFKLPASTLSNQMTDIQTLFGQEGTDLEEQVMLAADNAQRVNILSRYLQNKLVKNNISQPGVFSAVSEIIQTKGTTSIKQLASQYFLSTRQFERSFKHFAGFNPKLFSRIIRFQAALNAYGGKNITLTQIAYDCGYYDQSHFIHEFKEFSGYHPKQYFLNANEGRQWRDA